MTIIEQIKAEIERQIKDPQEHCYGVSSVNKLRELLSFLSTLESEKPIPAELEEAAEAEENMIIEEVEEDDYGRPEIASTHVYNAFIHGAKWDRSQMMQEAVEGTVHLEPGAFPVIEIGVGRFGLKVKDKVRVIVCKKED